MQSHDVARDTALDALVLQAAAGAVRVLHCAVAADHEVDDHLSADTRRSIELFLVAGAEHAGARTHDAIDLLFRQTARITGHLADRDRDLLRARAVAVLPGAVAAPAIPAHRDRPLVRDEVAF